MRLPSSTALVLGALVSLAAPSPRSARACTTNGAAPARSHLSGAAFRRGSAPGAPPRAPGAARARPRRQQPSLGVGEATTYRLPLNALERFARQRGIARPECASTDDVPGLEGGYAGPQILPPPRSAEPRPA